VQDTREDGGVDVTSQKVVARSSLLAARAERLPEPHEDLDRATALLDLPEVAEADTVAAYVSIVGEPGTAVLLDRLRAAGKRVLLPVVLADRDLEFREYDGALVTGRLGMPCPPPAAPQVPLAEAAVVVVPALACDRRGHRLGRGGGSYDRALPRVAPDALTVALIHPEELWRSVPVDPHDQPVRSVLAGTTFVRVS
jgi:5-formyltetrahydrofolate cyclo-ligase